MTTPPSTMPPTPPVPPPTAIAPRRRWGIVAVVVVAVLVVAAAVAVVELKVLPSASRSGPPAAADLTFSQARQVAEGAVAGFQGGGWTLVLALGVATANATTVSVNATALEQNLGVTCPVTSIGGHSVNASFAPAYAGAVSAGIASLWLLGFRHSDNSLLFTEVVNGTATPVASISSSGVCGSIFGLLSPVSTTVLDSSNASVIANGAGGAAFLSAHPTAIASYGVFGGFSFLTTQLSSRWSVTYTMCPAPGSAPAPLAPQWTYNATIDAASGRVLFHQSALSSCATTPGSSTPSLSSSLALGTVLRSGSGSQHWYNVTVQSASSGITFGNVTPVVETATGTPIAPGAGWSLTMVAINGSTVGTFDWSTARWTQGGSHLFSAGLVLSLGSGATVLAGDVLVLIGDSAYPGSVQVAL